MVFFVYLERDDELYYSKLTTLVRADQYDIIFVPYGHLPIPVDSITHKDLFGNSYDVPIDDDDREIYFMIEINDLYQKLIDSNTLTNIDLAENIFEHSGEEGWVWDIGTLKFDELPKPPAEPHH